MKAIPRREQARISELARELGRRSETVREAIAVFNDAVAGPQQKLEAAAEECAATATALRELLDDLATTAEAYVDNRSDRWRESDPGAAYAAWAGELSLVADTVPEIDVSWFAVEEICAPELFDAGAWDHPASAAESSS